MSFQEFEKKILMSQGLPVKHVAEQVAINHDREESFKVRCEIMVLVQESIHRSIELVSFVSNAFDAVGGLNKF